MHVALGASPVFSKTEDIRSGWAAAGDQNLLKVLGRADLLVGASAGNGLQHPTLHRCVVLLPDGLGKHQVWAALIAWLAVTLRIRMSCARMHQQRASVFRLGAGTGEKDPHELVEAPAVPSSDPLQEVAVPVPQALQVAQCEPPNLSADLEELLCPLVGANSTLQRA